MMLREIFRFEFLQQARRPWPWLAFAVLFVFAFENTRSGMMPVTLQDEFILNSPFIIAVVSVFSSLIWLLVSSAMAGEAAARDLQGRVHPLMYTAPISKVDYLGGRMLAAFTLNAMVLLGVQAGSISGVYLGGVDPVVIGPFRPDAYLAAYAFISLPNACVATALQFAFAQISRRSLASYFASMMLVFLSVPLPLVFYMMLGQKELALMLDPIGMLAIMNEMMTEWTIADKNARMFTLEGAMLANRLLWLGIASAVTALLFLRFRFSHEQAIGRLSRRAGLADAAHGAVSDAQPVGVHVATLAPSFGHAVRLRQTLAIANSSFRMITLAPVGLFLLLALPALIAVVIAAQSEHWGVQLLPRTGYVLSKYLTAPLTFFGDFRAMVPLVIIYIAGELVWRERDAGIADNIDVTPVPEWVFFCGKLIGMVFVLAALMLSMSAAGLVAQRLMGYHEAELMLYLKTLFGLQLVEYVLFAVLVLVIHVLVNHKHVGMLAGLAAFFFIIFASFLGVHHNLLVYGSGPEWTFTDMRGFGGTVGPWLWLRLYWGAWALLLALLAQAMWSRGREAGFRSRLRVARQRMTRPALAGLAIAAALVLGLGGFVFYNTNVLNEYITAEGVVQRRADYERLYGAFEGRPQPVRAETKLHIELYPDRNAATVRGSYRLVNHEAAPIDSVHIENAFYVTTTVTFDRAHRRVLTDNVLGHHIYRLEHPLQPGDSMEMSFEVRYEPRGFDAQPASLRRSRGATRGVFANGTFLTSGALPLIGYQPRRELMNPNDRRRHGLPRQVTLPAPGDIDPGIAGAGAGRFEAVIGTAADQVPVAPGALQRTWIQDGRRYAHYVSGAPIIGEELFFSARYALFREEWNGVDVQVYLHPRDTAHVERVRRSVRASLDYFSEQFGPYPYPFLQVVEQPGNFFGMGVDGSGVITGGEGFFLLNPEGEGFDVIFEAVAHEMAHQWWGMQLQPAFAEGGGVISEGLAWYSAMQLVKHEKDREALRRFMRWMREPDPWPPLRTGMPLLRAMDPWANYRKAPYAMHALSEYAGEARVNGALRALVEKQKASGVLATTLDMYRELQAAVPDSLHRLLRDLFETNTYWTFDTRAATALPLEDGTWQVTLDVEARKFTADSTGRDVEVPVTEWVEIGAWPARSSGEPRAGPMYLQRHRIRSGLQTITIVVPRRPVIAGADPYNLLDWREGDTLKPVEIREGGG